MAFARKQGIHLIFFYKNRINIKKTIKITLENHMPSVKLKK